MQIEINHSSTPKPGDTFLDADGYLIVYSETDGPKLHCVSEKGIELIISSSYQNVIDYLTSCTPHPVKIVSA